MRPSERFGPRHRADPSPKRARLIEIPGRTVDEPRDLVIGGIADRHWSAVIACREERVRIISVRRSRITRQSIIKVWITERLERKAS